MLLALILVFVVAYELAGKTKIPTYVLALGVALVPYAIVLILRGIFGHTLFELGDLVPLLLQFGVSYLFIARNRHQDSLRAWFLNGILGIIFLWVVTAYSPLITNLF